MSSNDWPYPDYLWQLFEMGLELSLARLKALAKFAFGMGLTQVWF
jgi:Kef-type K+ transport system membrane component KefB